MSMAWLGLKARALAWLEWAWAWNFSGQNPSPPPGLGLAWLWPEPGLEDFGGLNPVYLFKIHIFGMFSTLLVRFGLFRCKLQIFAPGQKCFDNHPNMPGKGTMQ
ncbi:hypothetical protein B0H17DRAFT_508489 [Mycena rosella]|uniref:Uncharacterized protein n=1 Tax=Mycena rosella TaxID=1033263 RepID=A0AAD7DJZ6_MYCRO|nr:hypothetical protein B0H17DRAFT_508489 [Mycena rosella]